jgi:hypothetical protein
MVDKPPGTSAGREKATRFLYVLGIVFCLFLVGLPFGRTASRNLTAKWVPPEDESNAKNYVDLLRQRQFDQIERDLDPSVADSDTRDALAKMAAVFPFENPESIKVVGLDLARGKEPSTESITLEYHFPSKWLLVEVVTRRQVNVSTLVGFHVDLISASLENLNRFTFVGKSAVQYVVLICAVCSVLFSLYVFVLCMQTKLGKTKWLWVLFTLVGVGKFAVNWTTGDFTFSAFFLQIPCARAPSSPYGPWTIIATIPIGALLFLDHRWSQRVKGELIEPATPRL